jgi:hypothetical protein
VREDQAMGRRLTNVRYKRQTGGMVLDVVVEFLVNFLPQKNINK